MNADIVRILAERNPPVRFAPGERWEYLNTGYTLLALIIERVARTSYPDFLKARIFEPLGMKDTRVLTVLDRERPKDLALGFMRRTALKEDYALPADMPVRGFMTQFGALVGARNVHSTAGDLLRWTRAMQSQRLVEAATMAQVLRPARLQDGSVLKVEVGAPVPSNYGLGWFIRTDAPHAYWHTGGYPGYSTFLEWDQDHNRTIVVLDNSFHSRTTYMAGHAAAGVLEGKPYTLGRISIAETLGPLVMAKGAAAAVARYRTLKAAMPEGYRFAEDELNRLGYDLMTAKREEDAIALFALNAEMFPQSPNVYDSLGEAYLKHGDKELAFANYEKSLKLDPKNEDALNLIRQLRSGKGLGLPFTHKSIKQMKVTTETRRARSIHGAFPCPAKGYASLGVSGGGQGHPLKWQARRRRPPSPSGDGPAKRAKTRIPGQSGSPPCFSPWPPCLRGGSFCG